MIRLFMCVLTVAAGLTICDEVLSGPLENAQQFTEKVVSSALRNNRNYTARKRHFHDPSPNWINIGDEHNSDKSEDWDRVESEKKELK